MNGATIVSALLLSIMMTLGPACGGSDVPTPAYMSLMDNLRESGATVDPVDPVDIGGLEQSAIFSVDSRIMSVNGSEISVLEYVDAAAADAGAASISPDGYTINNDGRISMVEWGLPPHFYRAGVVIVLYTGEDQAVMDVLETVLGSQFAGS